MSNPSLILPQSPAFGENNVYAARVEDGAVPLYNVLPLDFTRASNGTRVNKDGLIENMPYNLLEYSEQFDNAYWLKVGGTVTANAGVSPIGTTTADRFYIASAANNTRIYANYTFETKQYTLSVYAKNNGSTDSFRFSFYDGVGQSFSSDFALTNDWKRYDYTFTAAAGSGGVWIVSTSSTGVGSELDILIWGAQLNIGSTAKPYLATTDRLDMPRITYPIGGGCGSLLLEPQRTNLITYSEQFDNADWIKLATTASANNTTSPDGTQNADLITADGTNSIHRVAFTIALGAGKTLSVFAKSGTNNFLQFYTDSTNNDFANFDLANGVVGTKGPDATSSIEDYGNGWYRCVMTTGNAASANFSIVIVNSASAARAQSNTLTTSVYLWGAMIETGTYPTSYIPTTSAAATRVADSCSKTGISDLIGQSEGTLYWEVDFGVNDISEYPAIFLWDGTSTNRMLIQRRGNTSKLQYQVVVGGVIQVDELGTTLIGAGKVKIAFAYKANDFVVYLNGSQEIVDTSGSTYSGALSQIAFQNLRHDKTSQLTLYKTRLTNTELANITSL